MDDDLSLVPSERIDNAILLIRGQKVMLNADLAVPYGVETRILVRNVRRNADRFPPDFMFQLTQEEFECLRSQFGISNTSPSETDGRHDMTLAS